MNKTLLLKGMTAGTVGQPGTEEAVDITEAVLSVKPELRGTPITNQLFSTIVARVKEGKAKYLLNRKVHITRHNSTDDIHGSNATGGATIGTVSTAGFKTSQKDTFRFRLNKSWDTGFVYDKKKDPKVREGDLIDDLGSLAADIMEEKMSDFHDAVNREIDDKDGAVSKTYPTYVSSRDGKTKATPGQVSVINTQAVPTIAEQKEFANKLITTIWNKVEEMAQFGLKNSKAEGYPYARGTRQQLNPFIIIKSNLKLIVSMDERFINNGISAEMVDKGIIGYINGVKVITDDYFDTTSNFDVMITPTGAYGPVIKAEEMVDAFAIVDHPSKPTRAQLLDGSGGWDTAITPYFVLTRFIKVEEATSSPAPQAGDIDLETFVGDVMSLTTAQRTKLKELFGLAKNAANDVLQAKVDERK